MSQVAVEDGTYTLVLSGNYDTLVDRLDDYSIHDLSVRETSLEDVFMHFYGEEAFETEEVAETGPVEGAPVTGETDTEAGSGA